jgi:hypothetical protein
VQYGERLENYISLPFSKEIKFKAIDFQLITLFFPNKNPSFYTFFKEEITKKYHDSGILFMPFTFHSQIDLPQISRINTDFSFDKNLC